MLKHAAAQTTSTAQTAPRIPRPSNDGEIKRDLRNNLRFSLVEGSAFSLMVGMGETYLPAFVLWMGLGNVLSGLITTIPLLAGACLQLIAPRMVQHVGSYRKWVVICATVQAGTFLLLVASCLAGALPAWLAYLSATIYWAGGLAASGAWNSWMGTLIPPRVQVGFFTKRTRLTQATVFLGFVIGGVALHFVPQITDKKWAYVGIFTLAFACRMASIRWLRRQTEPVPPPKNINAHIGLKEFAQRLHRGHEQGRLFTYLLSVTFSAFLAAPYFTSYMLGEMKLPYASYAILIASSYLSKVMLLPYLGRMAASRGTRPLLMLGGCGIILLPALWLVSNSVPYLIFVQALSGFTWGAYELASLLLIWELVKPEERTCAMTTYNVANALSMTVGSLLGGFLLSHFGTNARAFAILFLVSTSARAATLFWMSGVSSRKLRWRPIGFRTLSMRPSVGSVALPIITHLKAWKNRRDGRN